MQKKSWKVVLLAALVSVGLFGGSALAANDVVVDIDGDDDGIQIYNIGNESYTGDAFDTAIPAVTGITYTNKLSNPNEIWISLVGGQFLAPTELGSYLLSYEGADFEAVVNSGMLQFSTLEPMDPETEVSLVGELTDINIQLNAGITGLQINVIEKNALGETVVDTTASLAQFANEYNVYVEVAANATVDATEGNRLSFVEFPGVSDTVVVIADFIAGDGTFLLADLDGDIDFEVTLTSSNQAVDDDESSVAYDAELGAWVLTSDEAVFELVVDGVTPIQTRAFTVAAVSVPGDDFTAVTYSTAMSAGSWTINGVQATVPYMINHAGYLGHVRVLNTSTVDALVFVDMVGFDANTVSIEYGAVDAGNGITLTTEMMEEIAAAQGWVAGTAFQPIITVTAPSANFDAYQYRLDNGFSRTLTIQPTAAAEEEM